MVLTKQERVKEIIERLRIVYPHPKTALDYTSPLDHLIATMLSAQTTDKLVNQVTPNLFKRYKSASDYAQAEITELDNYIKRVNFHNNKTKNIIAAGKIIVEKYNGKIPDTMEELNGLPGVARKTANVVLSTIFGKYEGIVVDTHVMRLSKKLMLTDKADPVKIEKDLMEIVPKKDWKDFSHLLILHGRDICTARPHTCADCPLGNLCPDKKV